MSVSTRTCFLAATRIFALGLLAGASFSWFPDAHAYAGRLVFASGDVSVRPATGDPYAVTRGAQVDAGDTILTGNGRAQLRFVDGGIVSLLPQTEYRIDEYRFEPAEEEEQGLFSLIRGGLRAITGLIGKRDPDSYRISTSLATIGIRGTTFTARLCSGDCRAPDGLYVRGGEGTVFVQNPFGIIDLSRGEAAYVPPSGARPRATSRDPEVTAPSSDDTASASPLASAGEDDGFDFSQVALSNELNIFGDTETFDFSALLGFFGNPNIVSFLSPSGAGVAVATETRGFSARGLSFSNSAAVLQSVGSLAASQSLRVGLGPNNGVLGFGATDEALTADLLRSVADISSASGGALSAIVVFDSVKNPGRNGGLYWGRWTDTTVSALVLDTAGPFASDSATLDATTNIHYILGDSAPNLPSAGIATYAFAGGTPSTSAGVLGTGALGGTIQVNFAQRTFHLDDLRVLHGSTFIIDSFGRVTAQGGLDSWSTTVQGASSADVAGFLTGAQAVPGQAGIAYEIQRNGSPIAGVAGFNCGAGC